MRARRSVVLGLASLLACCVGMAYLGLQHREQTARCPNGLRSLGARCCGLGQTLEGSHCTGPPRACAAGQQLTPRGCVAVNQRVRLPAGALVVAANDWELVGEAEPRRAEIAGFWLDSLEVTRARYHHCEDDPASCPPQLAEPGLPQVNIRPSEAAAYCARHGGRLPSIEEWMYAASALGSSRYPWGPTGLVCRRASFGLTRGPCASGARTPELAGARPPGATNQGVFDLSGNVAEWVTAPEGHRAMGGSYRSALAGELKFWSSRRASRAASDVGFRCAYPAASPQMGGSGSDSR